MAGFVSSSSAQSMSRNAFVEEVETSARAKQPCRLCDLISSDPPTGTRHTRESRSRSDLSGQGTDSALPWTSGNSSFVLLLEAPRGRELLLGVVDADYAGTRRASHEGDIRRAAAELDRVPYPPIDGQRTDLRFGHVPDPPGRIGPSPNCARRTRDELPPESHSQRAVAADVLREIVIDRPRAGMQMPILLREHGSQTRSRRPCGPDQTLRDNRQQLLHSVENDSVCAGIGLIHIEQPERQNTCAYW